MGVHRIGHMQDPPRHVLGIDVDTKAAHFAIVDTHTGRFQTNSCVWPVGDFSEGRRLIEARLHVHRFTQALQAHFPALCVAVERPTGRFPKPALMMTAGVVCEAVGAASGVAPFFLAVAEWRKRIGLKGNCTKDDVVSWAQSVGWTGERVDQAEALGIAVAGCDAWGVEVPDLTQEFREAA